MSTRAFRSNSRAIKAADGTSNNGDFSPSNIITCTSAGFGMVGWRTCHNAWWYGGYSRTAFGGDFGQGLEEQAVPGHGEQNSGHREHRTQKAGETNQQQTITVKPLKPQWILKGWLLFCYPRTLQRLLPGGQSAERTHGYYIFGRAPADVLKGHGQGAFFVQQVVRHHQGEGSRHGKVRHETDE